MAKSEAIAHHTMTLLDWPGIERLHCYHSRSEAREVDTGWLNDYVAAKWPHIELTVGDVSRTAVLPVNAYDVIIIPLLAFDESGNRLGYGGGWYDRFLAEQPQALKIGLAYDVQRAPTLPVEPHDRSLDYVVTEANIFPALRRSGDS